MGAAFGEFELEALMSYSGATSETHDILIRALIGKRGQVLRTGEILELAKLTGATDKEIRFLQPPDHCQNHAPNHGACQCSQTSSAPLEQGKRGHYQVII